MSSVQTKGRTLPDRTVWRCKANASLWQRSGFSIIGPLLHHFNGPTIIIDQWKAKRDHKKPAEFWPGGITWYSTVWVWRSNTRTPVPGERFTALIALSQMLITDVRIQGHPAATQVCSVWLGQTKISAWRLEKNRKKLRKCWKIRPIMAEEIALPLQLIWLMAITVDIPGPVPSWILLRYSSASL